jgi:DNA invertase Pin-like site-specific DNA recombinase
MLASSPSSLARPVPSRSLRWAIYAREHSYRPESAADQIRQCRQRAESDGLQVVLCLEEEKGASARTPGARPQFNRLLGHVEEGEVTSILCEGFDRLARNMLEAGKIARLMAEGKLQEVHTTYGVFRWEADPILTHLI